MFDRILNTPLLYAHSSTFKFDHKPMFYFQFHFLTFSGGIEMEHWLIKSNSIEFIYKNQGFWFIRSPTLLSSYRVLNHGPQTLSTGKTML